MPYTRYLTVDDYSQWEILRLAYLAEEGLPIDLTEVELFEQFLLKTKKQIIWGYFDQSTLASIAKITAEGLGIGKLGGVYTDPALRKKGYAKALLHQLMHDVQKTHNLHKLLIFTGEDNNPANRLYESLQAKQIGYFALFFGK